MSPKLERTSGKKLLLTLARHFIGSSAKKVKFWLKKSDIPDDGR
jgi:hypothetical protein